MGLRRDRESKAPHGARRSTKAPASSKPRPRGARREKAHAPVAARPARPRKLKPAPPVTACAKCRVVAEARTEATRLRREITRRDELDRARVAQALAGGPVTISDAEVAECLQRVYGPAFEEVVRVPLTIATSAGEDAGDRLKAVSMIVERIAGKVTDKVQHSGSIAGVALVCDFPVAGGPSPAPPVDPEQAEGSGA